MECFFISMQNAEFKMQNYGVLWTDIYKAPERVL